MIRPRIEPVKTCIFSYIAELIFTSFFCIGKVTMEQIQDNGNLTSQ